MGYLVDDNVKPFIVDRNLRKEDFADKVPVYYGYKDFARFKGNVRSFKRERIINEQYVEVSGVRAFTRQMFICTTKRWEYILEEFYGGWVHRHLIIQREPFRNGTKPSNINIIDASIEFKYLNNFMLKYKNFIYREDFKFYIYYNKNMYNLKDIIEDVIV